MAAPLQLPASPYCPACGTAAGPGQQYPGMSASSSSPVTPDDIAAWRALMNQQARYYLRAARKRTFAMTVTTKPVKIPFTPGRIASQFFANQPIWIGGGSDVAVDNGVPLAALQAEEFGPEEGDSETWVVVDPAIVTARLYGLELQV